MKNAKQSFADGIDGVTGERKWDSNA